MHPKLLLASGYDCSMIGWCRYPYTAPLYKHIDEVGDACSKDFNCKAFEYNDLELVSNFPSYGRLCNTTEGSAVEKYPDLGFRRCAPINSTSEQLSDSTFKGTKTLKCNN